jgi:hypothetical protein
LRWPWPFLADTDRVLYARLGMRRASLRNVYSPRTLRRYAGAFVRGQRVRRPVEDTRQLGGDAVLADGRAVWVYLPRGPDDRPSMDTIEAALREVARNQVDGAPPLQPSL